MLKSSIAIISLVALAFVPLPGVTTSAFAQQVCAGAKCPNGGGGSTTYTCANEMGLLRRVYESELKAVTEPENVWVVTVCEGEDYGVMLSDGNAGGLRKAIARNKAMMEVLTDKAFTADDVVGIRMTAEDKAILYVHPFHHH